MRGRVRLYLVRPPDEASTGKPVSARASYKAHRVRLTVAASFGALACALMRANRGLAGEEFLNWPCALLSVAGDAARVRLPPQIGSSDEPASHGALASNELNIRRDALAGCR
jgi:hypothetical protein